MTETTQSRSLFAERIVPLDEAELAAAHRHNEELMASLGDSDTVPDLSDPDAYLRGLRGDTWWYQPQSEDAREEEIAGVPVRLFEVENPVGLYVRIHGGGFVYGSAAAEDVFTWRMARDASLTVLSVEYRLAPENPWPAANDDCAAVATWAVTEGLRRFGGRGVFVGGESAGAHLALCTALRLRDAGLADAVTGTNLVAGVYDMRGTPSVRLNRNKDPLGLTEEVTDFYHDCYVRGVEEDLRHPDISPLWADLKGLGPVLLSTGRHDPLIDNAVFLASRLELASVEVELDVYPAGLHGFEILNPVLADNYHRRFAAWVARQLPS